MNKAVKMMLMNQKNARGQDYGREDYGRQHRSKMDYDRDYMDRDYGRYDDGRRRRDYERDYGRDDDRMDRGERRMGGYGREPRRREMVMEGRAGMDDDGDWHVSGQVSGPEQMDHEAVKRWMDKLQNADGSKGPHWSFDQAKQLMAQKSIDCDPDEFWAALNMMFSDYAPVAKKHNASTVDFYVEMAKAFLDDKDAKPDKLGRYYRAVVK